MDLASGWLAWHSFCTSSRMAPVSPDLTAPAPGLAALGLPSRLRMMPVPPPSSCSWAAAASAPAFLRSCSAARMFLTSTPCSRPTSRLGPTATGCALCTTSTSSSLLPPTPSSNTATGRTACGCMPPVLGGRSPVPDARRMEPCDCSVGARPAPAGTAGAALGSLGGALRADCGRMSLRMGSSPAGGGDAARPEGSGGPRGGGSSFGLLRDLVLGAGGSSSAGGGGALDLLLRSLSESDRFMRGASGSGSWGGGAVDSPNPPASSSRRCCDEGREEGRAAGGGALAGARSPGLGWCSPASTRCTASAPFSRRHAWASIWRNTFVFSGSRPATILSGFAGTCSPRTSPTTSIIFDKYVTLASLSWIDCATSSSPEYIPGANPVLVWTAVITSCKYRKGGFVKYFSWSLGLSTMGLLGFWSRSTVSCQ
mmetsp:Transcript_4923/g.12065  ORF Transcript_4923/g.12065 Transcript_4923/m.12065 type:complete len:426 (+) Transcript_4923:611-1888(+)